MRLSPEDLAGYRARGYHVARGLFSPEEIARVLAAAEQDKELERHAFDRADGEGELGGSSSSMELFRSRDEGQTFQAVGYLWRRSPGQWLQGGARAVVKRMRLD